MADIFEDTINELKEVKLALFEVTAELKLMRNNLEEIKSIVYDIHNKK